MHAAGQRDLRLELVAEATSVGLARHAVSDFAGEVGADPDAVAVAVSEAVTNAVVHAYPHEREGGDPGRGQLNGTHMVVLVSDHGHGIRPNPGEPRARLRPGAGGLPGGDRDRRHAEGGTTLVDVPLTAGASQPRTLWRPQPAVRMLASADGRDGVVHAGVGLGRPRRGRSSQGCAAPARWGRRSRSGWCPLRRLHGCPAAGRGSARVDELAGGQVHDDGAALSLSDEAVRQLLVRLDVELAGDLDHAGPADRLGADREGVGGWGTTRGASSMGTTVGRAIPPGAGASR